MALFDFLTGGQKKRNQSVAGPGNAGGGNEEARKKRLADMQGQYDEQNKKSAADRAAKDAADKASKDAAKKKKSKEFWGKVLGKNDG